MSNSTQNQYLTDVAIIRPLLVVLLVLYHSFAIYCGGWDPIDGFPEIKSYWWIGKTAYAFMLEMFVFLSGYVFGYQVLKKGNEALNLKTIVKNKFKRLLIPSFFFSFLYLALFRGLSSQSISHNIYDIIAGAGHMWFLPMLFWCFLLIWLIEKLGIKAKVTILLLLAFSVFPQLPLPFQLSHTFYYLLFFYVGYYIKRSGVDENKLNSTRVLVLLTLAFLILFPCLTVLQQNIISEIGGGIIERSLRVSLLNLTRVLYASLGVVMLLSIVGCFVNRRTKGFPQWLLEIGSLCMGVYLFQQFILILLYEHTSLPCILGPYWLPWIGFILTLFLSILFSFVFRRTRWGRILIG